MWQRLGLIKCLCNDGEYSDVVFEVFRKLLTAVVFMGACLKSLRMIQFSSSKQKTISSLYFFISTSGFHQCLCYERVITMICRDHVIDKMANVYNSVFLARLKKNEFITLLRMNYC